MSVAFTQVALGQRSVVSAFTNNDIPVRFVSSGIGSALGSPIISSTLLPSAHHDMVATLTLTEF